MAMEINEIRPDYPRQYPVVNKTEKSENDTPVNKIPQDEYISSEKAANKPSGLYGLAQDENGKLNMNLLPGNIYKREDRDDKSEKCTTNTDSVDREIEKLKEEEKQIQQQIRSANVNEEKKKELERKLAQIENELSQKDTDAYRRQNAVTNEAG